MHVQHRPEPETLTDIHNELDRQNGEDGYQGNSGN